MLWVESIETLIYEGKNDEMHLVCLEVFHIAHIMDQGIKADILNCCLIFLF